MPTSTTKSRPSQSKPAPWKSLPDAELAAYLLERQTIPDQAWADRAGRKKRREGESRSDFIQRCLLARPA
jgi:hypothetical protein